MASDATLLQRVKIGRMSVDYAILERARTAPDKLPLGPLAKKRFQPFIDMIPSAGVTRLNEWSPFNLDDYRSKLAAALGITP